MTGPHYTEVGKGHVVANNNRLHQGVVAN